MAKIAVLGAGINGVTCALRIKEKYRNADVSLIKILCKVIQRDSEVCIGEIQVSRIQICLKRFE